MSKKNSNKISKRDKLVALKKEMKEDSNLPLAKGANQLVFGEGDANAEIIFIGEGPGYWEDQKGRPFVGRAGSLLSQLLHSIKVRRNNVFITNVVHHRPPNNRDPEPKELESYGKYLDQMIDIISPKAIVTLGRYSMAKFIPNVKISGVHGKKHVARWHGRDILIIPMYHPAAALRNGNIKKELESDFRKIPTYIEEYQITADKEMKKKIKETAQKDQLDLV